MAIQPPRKQDESPRARPTAVVQLQLPSIDIEYKQRLGGGNWLDLIEIEYCKPSSGTANDQALFPASTSCLSTAPANALPKRFAYEVCCRCHSKAIDQTISLADDAIEAADMIAILKQRNEPPRMVLVVQFRPATGLYTIEWPSGLIDPGESIAEAALRELWEETGYHGTVISQSPALPCEPGLTSSKSCIVHIEIDGDALRNSDPRTHGGEDEWSLQTALLPLDGLLPSLLDLTRHYHPKLVIDSRLYSFAQGLVLGQLHWPTVK
ncbi:hypothetical protein H4R34_003543 [Dimargaris verticillata]|uniref:Nudix hydrolase domain-containing protein n=1 Tax=Dimargaris verticillata TaxID=2761393 RepID=A0A9W8E8Y8_9FUNG|nr:hypothetical protein H4R34_003543 [Dimargaris verticillata]